MPTERTEVKPATIQLNCSRTSELQEGQSKPSTQMAWLIGYLLSRGDINRSGNIVKIAERRQYARQQIVQTIESIFSTTPEVRITHPKPKHPNHKPQMLLCFNSPRIVQTLGNFSRDNWPEIIDKHKGWIFSDAQFADAFINGLFASRGFTNKKKIIFNSENSQLLGVICDALSHIGVEKPFCGKSHAGVSNVKDARVLAQHLKSPDPNIEAILEIHRRKELPPKPITDIDLIREWTRIRIPGYTHPISMIKNLNAHHLAKYDYRTYMAHFGAGKYTESSRFVTTYEGVESIFLKTKKHGYELSDADITFLISATKVFCKNQDTGTVFGQENEAGFALIAKNTQAGLAKFPDIWHELLSQKLAAEIEETIDAISLVLFGQINASQLISKRLYPDGSRFRGKLDDEQRDTLAKIAVFRAFFEEVPVTKKNFDDKTKVEFIKLLNRLGEIRFNFDQISELITSFIPKEVI